MNQRTERPSLQGIRVKSRKRDEKEKYEPATFRDSLIKGLNEIDSKGGTDIEAISKYLDSAGNRLDYRRYSDVLFDILFAGGLLAPGGSIIEEPGRDCRTYNCVFACDDNLEALRKYYDVFIHLIRRYQYLEKSFEVALTKIVRFARGFTPEDRSRLATVTSLLLANNVCTAKVLTPLFDDHLVKDDIALMFITGLFKAWLLEKDVNSIYSTLKKSGLENKLLELLPVNRRSLANIQAHFCEHRMEPIAEMLRMQSVCEMKKELNKGLKEMIKEDKSSKEIIAYVKEQMETNSLPEHEVIVLIWNTLMSSIEWNKKDELVADQAMKHLRLYLPVLVAFVKGGKSELALINKVQEYCYDNMNFLKVFQKIIVLFYKAEILSEETILRWYKTDHSPRGKSIFIEQMKPFIEWLENASEESSEEEN